MHFHPLLVGPIGAVPLFLIVYFLCFLFLDRQTPANKRHTYEVAGGISCMSAGQALRPTTITSRVESRPIRVVPCVVTCEPIFCLPTYRPSLASFLTHRKYVRSRHPVPLRTCSPDWLGCRKGVGHTKITFKGAASRSSFPLSYMFDAATVTVQITKCRSLIPFSCAQFVLRFFFQVRCVCRSSSGKSLWSHHRHVDYTRATFGSLHTFVFFNFSCFSLSLTLLSC
ncbi:hypothetical protein J3E68DRAFT_57606 [Trichoderma sp. SZMC 28012]